MRQWDATVDTHRRQVRGAILNATAALVAERGLRSVTMAEIADRAGIGRATLYRYFPDVEAILVAWHEGHIAAHLARLVEIRDGCEHGERLLAVLEGYAVLSHRSHGDDAELSTLLHRDPAVSRARRRVRELLRGVIAEAAEAGEVRDDVSPDELAGYSLHALNAAAELTSKAAVHRLVAVIVAGLGPSRGSPSR